MIKKILLLIGLTLVLVGCDHFHSAPKFGMPANLDTRPPPGPPEYQQGWSDGCESGWKAYASQFNKVFFEYKQDYILSQNPVYYQIWKDAYAYCAQYANSTVNQGFGMNDNAGAWIFGKW